MASLITKPSGAISLEEALQNLASALTGKNVKEMPASLEGIVQFMASNVTPGGGGGDVEELAGSVAEKLKADDTFISALAEKLKTNEALTSALAEKLKTNEALTSGVSTKLQADDTFITAVADKVAAKAVPGGAPGMEGPSMASLEASEGPSITAVSTPTAEPAVASVPTKAASAATKRKTSKTTE